MVEIVTGAGIAMHASVVSLVGLQDSVHLLHLVVALVHLVGERMMRDFLITCYLKAESYQSFKKRWAMKHEFHEERFVMVGKPVKRKKLNIEAVKNISDIF